MIAAWLTEALTRRHGLAGLGAGLDLLRGLLVAFWENLFPEVEDGDLEPRAAAFEFLASERVLPLILRQLPLTDGFGEKRYSYLRRKEARDVDNVGRQDPSRRDAMLARYLAEPKPVVWAGAFDARGEAAEDALPRCYAELLATRDRLYRAMAHVTLDGGALEASDPGVEGFLARAGLITE